MVNIEINKVSIVRIRVRVKVSVGVGVRVRMGTENSTAPVMYICLSRTENNTERVATLHTSTP